jgi:hypothetical protein
MTSGCSRFAVAVVVGFLVFLPGCHHDIDHSKQLGPLHISLAYNSSDGSCQQNGSAAVIDVWQDQQVIYQGAAVVPQFQVQFPRCPFGSCPIDSPNGSPVNAGTPSAGARSTTYNYSGMTIGNKQCNNPGAMGLRMRP